ncbi:hypothetical protein SJ05684_c21850 [Sinorhizobium sojae CCBAU 05684]|uniref:Uncharacterized protein n=1 Tax=Sinorhizobium sojae CCBAU 05684 TaxID=716928 RepID=A0A249PCS1_9HYPH|nr:hypothetical protein SJ05684_c21850 [Sinorhizobium sojae CCBAU 05684]
MVFSELDASFVQFLPLRENSRDEPNQGNRSKHTGCEVAYRVQVRVS